MISRFAFGLLYLLIELSYFTLVCPWCGRMVVWLVYGHVITKFSVIFRVSYPWCSAVRVRALLLDGCYVS